MQGKASEAYEEATDWAKEKYERASSWAADAYEQGAGRAKSVGARSGRQFARARGGVQGYVAQNPIVVAWSAWRPAFSSGRFCRGRGARTRPSANGPTRLAIRACATPRT